MAPVTLPLTITFQWGGGVRGIKIGGQFDALSSASSLSSSHSSDAKQIDLTRYVWLHEDWLLVLKAQ